MNDKSKELELFLIVLLLIAEDIKGDTLGQKSQGDALLWRCVPYQLNHLKSRTFAKNRSKVLITD